MTQVTGWISIRGLRCDGRQGVSETERQRVQRYLVDVAVRTDVAAAARADTLDDALDIAALASCVRNEVVARPRALLERMTVDVAEAVLARFASVEEVRVRVEKPEPSGLDAEAEAVEIVVARSAP